MHVAKIKELQVTSCVLQVAGYKSQVVSTWLNGEHLLYYFSQPATCNL